MQKTNALRCLFIGSKALPSTQMKSGASDGGSVPKTLCVYALTEHPEKIVDGKEEVPIFQETTFEKAIDYVIDECPNATMILFKVIFGEESSEGWPAFVETLMWEDEAGNKHFTVSMIS